MKAGETYQQLDRKISDLKKQLPFRSPHYFHFLEDHRAQKFIDSEAFTFQTTVDIDNPEEVEPAVKTAIATAALKSAGTLLVRSLMSLGNLAGN